MRANSVPLAVRQSAAEAAAHTGTAHCLGRTPASGQGFDVRGGNAGFLFGPLRRFGRAVYALSKDIVRPLVKTVRVFFNVFLVIEPFGAPYVSNGRTERGIGAGTGSKPLVRLLDRGKVIIRIDIDKLYAQILQPVAPHGGLVARVAAAGRIRVVGPHDHGLDILQCILQKVKRLGSAQTPVIPVRMRRAPGEAFPGIGIILDLRIAEHTEKACECRELIAKQAPGMVGAGAGRNGLLAVCALNPLDFTSNQVQRFVPGSTAIAGFSSVLRIPILSVRGFHKIFPDHRVTDTVVRIGAVFLSQRNKSRLHFPVRGEFLPAGHDNPTSRVVVVLYEWADTSHDAVFRIEWLWRRQRICCV